MLPPSSGSSSTQSDDPPDFRASHPVVAASANKGAAPLRKSQRIEARLKKAHQADSCAGAARDGEFLRDCPGRICDGYAIRGSTQSILRASCAAARSEMVPIEAGWQDWICNLSSRLARASESVSYTHLTLPTKA